MAEIVEKELWDHYSELPNPAWYEYKENMKKKYPDNIVYNEEKDKFYRNLVFLPTEDVVRASQLVCFSYLDNGLV